MPEPLRFPPFKERTKQLPEQAQVPQEETTEQTTEGTEFPESLPEEETATNEPVGETNHINARLASVDIAGRIPHSSVEGLLDSAEKVYQYLLEGRVTESS